MNRERLMTVLLGPHVSEKSTTVADDHNQIVFRVRRDASKTEVRRAVEMMFEVEVEGVQILNQGGKQKRFGRTMGKRSDWKKAYVRLKAGQDIDFLGGD
ncbi:MAG: 50S ribosomal protein L23 [Chromatiales bacterium]|jgi:large subunit ribosomal protein L23|nr:50S ribosomal protein L23 [Chromatiales bacterium]PLX56875.1 MAG: 50S ribosomal protein L23 [Chromatiales bacterium]